MEFYNGSMLILLVTLNIIAWEQWKFGRKLMSGKPIDTSSAKKCALTMTIRSIESDSFWMKAVSRRNGVKLPPLQLRTMFSLLLPCLSTANTKLNYKHNNSKASGWVLPYYRKNTIWLNSYHWEHMPMIEKTRIMIHECSHLGLDTYDYAYSFEEKYSFLRGRNATANADTITNIILEINNYIC